jgi:PAS domain S-box-containing protein
MRRIVKSRILIVDDEPDIALILKLHLEDQGYETARARDGVEALECLGREQFDLMLLDIKMPRMDGIRVLEKIRELRMDLAVIMMTAHGSEYIAVESMKKGAIDYVAKPFSVDELLKKVERSLQYSRARRENLRLQREIEEERNKMEAILQGMADLLVAVDSSGAIMSLNRKAEEVLHVSREKVLGKQVAEVLKTDLPQEQLPCLVTLRTGAPCLDNEYTIISRRRKVPVLASATPLITASGTLLGCVEIIRDISALKALEQEREDFVSMLTHDLKTPITAVVGSIDLVRDGHLGQINGEQCTYLDAAVESCTEMVEMINTLLDVHRFEAGLMKLHPQEEFPESLLKRMVSTYRTVAEREGIRLTLALEDSLPLFSVDRNMFARLMGNLLSNALKFTPSGGEVEVSAECLQTAASLRPSIPEPLYPPEAVPDDRRYLHIAVRDTGVGIPADALTAIFDRFVQARSRRMGKTKGSGLGLAYCRKVMDAHGGFIWAESLHERGSTLHALFPLQ